MLYVKALVTGKKYQNVIKKNPYKDHRKLESQTVHLLHYFLRDTSVVMEKLRAKFGARLSNFPLPTSDLTPTKALSSVNLETNLLELFYRGILLPTDAERSLKV